MSDYIIELDKVSCKSGRRYLLHEATWRIKGGEHWVVFGQNGSGKTTLLSIIAGFKHFTGGEVKIFGEPFSNETILSVRQRIGWVSSSFFDRFYTKESALHIVLSGKSGTLGLQEDIDLEDVQLAKDLLSELHLADKIDYTFDSLSKGERQNVLIARALFAKPDILILDEPCTGLDVYNRSYLFSTIDSLSRKKDLTIIYVTHYLEEIIPLFDKALLLKNGRIFAIGETEQLFCSRVMTELLDHPAVVERERSGNYKLTVNTQSCLADIMMGSDRI